MEKPVGPGAPTVAAREASGVLHLGDDVAQRDADVEAELGTLDIVEDGRYEVRREIAAGGMGRILEAWDRRSRRAVAVKTLLDPGPQAMLRFVREARITARLQHPAIVPLYDVARWPSGEPFFAMKLVEGRSLAEAVAAADTLDDRLALLPHVVATTEALAYAHDRGVVHRDLKPSNVLVGAFGETVVIDWGLAKELHDAKDDRAPVAPALDHPEGLTVMGLAIGTPCYMPPEQARGEAVDPRADVYALGAMLYEVLAGAPPYTGGAKDVVAQVLAGPPPALPERAPSAPVDLVAIATKAMARERHARYATAKEMAGDLRRFVAGQLVTARRYSWRERLARWAFKNRTLLTMAAALVTAVGLTAGLSFRRIVRERDRADAMKNEADEQRRAAIARRDAAEDLAGYMVAELRERLAAVGRLDLLAGVGGRVDAYYRRVADLDDGASPAALGRRASALDTLAEVAMAKEDPAAARPPLEEAIRLRRRAIAEEPGDADLRARLVESELVLAEVQQTMAEADAGMATIRAAVDDAGALLAQEPSSVRAQELVARTQGALADHLAQEGDLTAALPPREAAAAALARVVEAQPNDLDAVRQLAAAHAGLAEAQNNIDHPDAVVREATTALALFDALVPRAPDDVGLAWARTGALQMLANGHFTVGDLAAALTEFEACAKERERLAARDPDNADWQRGAANCAAGVADTELELGHADRAVAVRERLQRMKERLLAAHPDNLEAQRDEVLGLEGMARALLEAKDARRAAALLEEANAGIAALLARDPQRSSWRWIAADLHLETARAALALRRLDAAADAARRATEAAEANVASAPDEDDCRWQRAEANVVAGEVAAARGEREAARAALETARAELEDVVPKQPDNIDWAATSAEAAHRLAPLLASGDAPAARLAVERAIGLLEAFDARGRLSPRRHALLVALRADLAALATPR